MSDRTASLLLVNHRVALPATAEHGAVAGSRLYYISHRPGSVATPSAEDTRADRDAAVMARLGYIGYRPGAQAKPGTHALFDADGVPDRATVARELADTHFFETLVRVHRASEGAPYTGLKPAGLDLGPAVPAADKALEDGAIEPVIEACGR